MENNSKKIDDGVKEGEKCWKTDTIPQVDKSVDLKEFKYPKLFVHTFYDVKG